MENKLLWPIEKLKNWHDNPREIKKEKYSDLRESLRQEGQFMPLLVDTRTGHYGEVLGGNMTLRALNELGVEEVWVEPKEPKSDAHAFELAIKHNMRYGQYIDEIAAELASKYKDQVDISKLDLDLGSPTSIQELLDKYSPVIEDEPPEIDDSPAISKYGEVYQLGRHRLMCGDSTKKEDVEKLMEGKKADMVFTDPPYGMDLDTDWSDMKGELRFAVAKGIKGGNKWNKVEGDNELYDPTFLLNTFSYCKEIFMWGGDYYAKRLPEDGSYLVWDKRVRDEFDKGFGSAFELCWSKQKHKREIVRVSWFGIFGTEQEFDHKRYHPTQKPIKLSSWFINKFSKDNQLIIDLFGGSGSTLIACEQTNRICYMMEIDNRYTDVIRKRYAKFIDKENEWQKITPKV